MGQMLKLLAELAIHRLPRCVRESASKGRKHGAIVPIKSDRNLRTATRCAQPGDEGRRGRMEP
jgi:hypothetical protein